MSDQPKGCKIKILKNGPVLVSGNIPLSQDDMIIGADNEPERWEKSHFYPPASANALCRCGGSARKPFCDGSHVRIGFDGTETAPVREDPALIERTEGPTLDLTWSAKICATARFCHRAGDAWTLAEKSDIPSCRETAIQEACDCPSGALTAYDKGSDKAIEPAHDPAVSLIENPTSGLSGPIRVLGGIPVESAAGTAYEVRNRMTLCRCGASNNKPFCDGTHTVVKFTSKG
jgi:CDGSH-type Zn-finger protein